MGTIENKIISGVTFHPLKIIDTPGGDVMHCFKSSDQGFVSFGEAYFSKINKGFIKGWKRHLKMTLNLTVIAGAIKIVIFDDTKKSMGKDSFTSYVLGPNYKYGRLTISPGLWVAFMGLEKENMLINISDIIHDPVESEKKEIDSINFKW